MNELICGNRKGQESNGKLHSVIYELHFYHSNSKRFELVRNVAIKFTALNHCL